MIKLKKLITKVFNQTPTNHQSPWAINVGKTILISKLPMKVLLAAISHWIVHCRWKFLNLLTIIELSLFIIQIKILFDVCDGRRNLRT